MAAISIFFISVKAIFFFVFGAFFNALASMANALIMFSVRALKLILKIVGIGILIGLGLSVIGMIAELGIAEALANTVFIVIIGLLALGLLTELGSIVVNIILVILQAVLGIVWRIFTFLTNVCERGYAKALNRLSYHIGRC